MSGGWHAWMVVGGAAPAPRGVATVAVWRTKGHDRVSVAPPQGLTEDWGTVSCIGVQFLMGRACIVSMTIVLRHFFRVDRSHCKRCPCVLTKVCFGSDMATRGPFQEQRSFSTREKRTLGHQLTTSQARGIAEAAYHSRRPRGGRLAPRASVVWLLDAYRYLSSVKRMRHVQCALNADLWPALKSQTPRRCDDAHPSDTVSGNTQCRAAFIVTVLSGCTASL